MSGAGRIFWYVLGHCLIGVLACLALVGSVVMLIDFVELSRTLGGRTDLGFFSLMGLTLLKSPSVIILLLPFIFLFGAMGAFVTLNRRGELVAMRAAGVSAWRFVLPAAVLAAVAGALTVTILNPLAAQLNGLFDDRRLVLLAGKSGGAGDLWLRQGDDRHQIFIHARSHDLQGGVVHLHNVSLFVQRVMEDGGADFSHRIEATDARLSPGFWRLRDARESLPGAQTVRSEQLSIASNLDRRAALEKFISPKAVGFWALPATIRSADLAGASSAGYQVRLRQLLVLPLWLAAMATLGAAFSLRLMRLGDLVAVAIGGVCLGFGVFFLNELCGVLGTTEVIPPLLAAAAPAVLALLLAATMLCYTEDG